MTHRRALLFVTWTAALATTAAACGSRTGLLVGGERPCGPGGNDGDGAGGGAAQDADGSLDGGTPPADAALACPDPRARLIYVVTQDGVAMSFWPPTATFTTIGTLVCGDASIFGPVSMAVDGAGVAYVLYDDGNLYRVSMRTGSCSPTAFSPGDGGIAALQGMTFVSAGASETLYTASSPVDGLGNPAPSVLGTVDTATLAMTTVGPLVPSVNSPELAGTETGELFAFYPTAGQTGAALSKVDPKTARVTGLAPIPGVLTGNAWSFAVWSGDFYLFTAAAGGATVVQRVRASDGSITQVASIRGAIVVGAGASTCTPSP